MTTLKSKNKFLKVATSTALVASTISTITAPISAASFPDIENSSHKDSIEQLLARGIVKGYEDGTFKPGKAITRGQAAKIIGSVLKLDTTNVINPNFSDIHTEMEFYPYIAALAEANIISGYEDGSFKPNQTITRGQMAKMIAIGFSLTTDNSHPFTDVSTNSQYSPFIAALYANEVTTGTTETTFSPKKHVTRGQLASFVIRAENKSNIKPADKKIVSGIISAVSTGAITINGVQYAVSQKQLLQQEKNRDALLNSDITIEVVNNTVSSIEKLSFTNKVQAFDGANIHIKQLVISNALTSLKNVQAEQITTLHNNTVASTNTVNATTQNLTIDQSSIGTLTLGGNSSITLRNSTVEILNALKSKQLTLSGLFNKVLVAANSTLTGNATITNFEGPTSKNAGISLDKLLIIKNMFHDGKLITLDQATQQFGYSLFQSNGVEQPSSPSTPSTPGGGTTKPGTGDQPVIEIPEGIIDLTNDTAVDLKNNEIIVDDSTYNLTTEQSRTIAAYIENISDLEVSVKSNGSVTIEKMTLKAVESFDGTNLKNVKNVELNGAVESISNVAATSLQVVSQAPKVAFENTSANITAFGTFEEISGASGQSLIIASTAQNVQLSNVSSKQVIIQETPIRPVAFSRAIASMSTFAATSTSTMTVTFGPGDYDGQTLTVERKDTVIDLRDGQPFSKITVSKDNVVLNAADVNALNVSVGNKVSTLTLNANAREVTLDLKHPITIFGNTKNIAQLTVTAPWPEATGWIELSGVTVGSTTLNGGTADSALFKGASSTNFVSSLTRKSFGIYEFKANVAADEQLKYVMLPEGAQINTTSIPADAIPYTGAFKPVADTPVIVVYKEKAGSFAGYSLAGKPIDAPITVANGLDGAGYTITYESRYSNAVTPQKAIEYLIVFKNKDEQPYVKTTFNGTWTNNGQFNTYKVYDTNLKLSGKYIVLSNKMVNAVGTTVTNDLQLYIDALKYLANFSVSEGRSNPEYIYDLLTRITTATAVPFDSSFLSKYVERINGNPDSFNTQADLEQLIKAVETELNYDRDFIKTPADLYLINEFDTDVEASTEGIVETTISDKGELLFIPKSVGKTTLKISDTAGNSTLVNVTVDSSKDITEFKIVEAPITHSEFLRGAADFRVYNKGTEKVLLPIHFKETIAITRDDDKFERYIVSNNGSQFELTNAPVTSFSAPITAFGLDTITKMTATLVGGFTTVDGKLVIYPIVDGKETITVSDGLNTTAIYVDATNGNVDASIAKSNVAFSIANDLHLLSAKTIEKAPANAKVHLYNNGSTIQAFAHDAAKASFTIKDQANNVSIVNVTAENNSAVTVKSLEIVKHALTLPANVTVQDVSSPIVRVVDNELYATGTGTATVTLSNGEQYTVTVGYENNQYDIDADKVENIKIAAADLQMTNIANVSTTFSAATTHLIDNNGAVVVSMTGDATATFVLTSTNNEKTVVHVTKSGTTYTSQVDRVPVTRQQLGLNALTGVIGSTKDIVPARAAVVTGGESVNIYNHEVGTRAFRVTDGTNTTAVNVTVTANGNSYTSTPKVVAHEIPATVTVKTGATINSNAAHLNGNTIYASGLGLNEATPERTISVPLQNGADYVIKVKLDPDTGLYSFDETATITFNKTFNKSELGLDTLSIATAPINTNSAAQVVGDNVIVSVTDNTETRIEVNGAVGTNLNARAFIYVKREDTNTANPLQIEVERTENAINLANYGYNSVPTALWSHSEIARAHIKNNLMLDLYALDVGTTRLTLGPIDQKLLVNVEVTGATKRSVNATVIEKELGQTGTIISGDGVRLSANKETVYATKENAKTIVRLADNTLVEYNVIVNADGKYELKEEISPADNTATIKAADLGLSGNITATGLNPAVASKVEFGDTISLTSVAQGKTALIVTDENGKKAIVNVTVDADKKIEVSPVVNTTATAPKLIHAEDVAVVDIKDDQINAIGEGTAELLVGNEIQQVVVSKEDGHYKISSPVAISSAIYTIDQLGFAANSAISIESGYEADKFYIGEFDGKIIAYSKLAGTTASSTEFIVKTSDTPSLRTLVRLKATGNTITEHKIAKHTHTLSSTATVADETIARITADAIYSFKPGYTTATVNNRLHAVDVTRGDDGYLKAETRALEISGTDFKAVAGTNADIIEISTNGDKVYATGFGVTEVQDGDTIYKVKIGKDATTNKATMTATEVSSKFVNIADAGLDKITDVTVLSGNANALSFNIAETSGITIYSDGSVTSQDFALKVTNGTHDAVINVTVGADGKITKAEVAKYKINTVGISATETVQTTKARAVWSANTITIYALEQGNAALKYTNGLVNAQINKSGNHLVPEAQLLSKDFGSAINTVTNSAMLTTFNSDMSFYPKAEGTALAYAGDKLYSISVTKNADQYALTVSNGVPFTTLDLTAAGGTYAANSSVLNGVKVVKDEDLAENKLVIYKETTGVSDISITTGDGPIIYHVTAKEDEVTVPQLAAFNLQDTAMQTAANFDGTAARHAGDKLYYLSTGAVSWKATNERLVSAEITRATNTGYFTATPGYVQVELKEAPTVFSSTFEDNFENDDKIVYALNGAASEVVVSDNYRTTLTTTKNGSAYSLTADQRQAEKIPLVDYALSNTLKEVKNTVENIAFAEIHGDDLYIYEGTVDGSTILSVTDSNDNTVKFNVTRNNNGANFTVTPLVAVNSVSFQDLDLNNDTLNITPEVADSSIATVTATKDGLNITPQNVGRTSITLKQAGVIVAIINIHVDANMNVISTPLVLDVADTVLQHSMNAPRVSTDKGTFITSTGLALVEVDATTAKLVRVTKNSDTGYYLLDETTHNFTKQTAASLGLTKISSVSLKGSSVGTFTKADGSELYIYGTNTGTTDVVVTEKVSDTKSHKAVIVANNDSSLTTTVAEQKLADADKLSTEWATNLVEIRNHVIYATQSGKGVATATLSDYKALMNIEVSRNTDDTFVINHKIVAHQFDASADVHVIDGQSVKLKDNRLFAQETGISTVQVDNDIYKVEVTQNAEGLYAIKLGEPVVQNIYEATDLGLTSISGFTIKALSGAGVISAKVVNNDRIVIYAKNAGEAELTVAGDKGNTIIHNIVTDTANGLTLTPTIAKVELSGASTLSDSTNTFRGEADELFALKAGHIVTTINGHLYNLNATTTNNKLDISAARIEKNMGAVPSISQPNTVLEVEGTKIVAKAVGETRVEVGSNNYRVKVNTDGTMQVELLVAGTIDVQDALSSVTNVESSSIANITPSGTVLTIEPTAVGTDIIEVSNADATIQVAVTVEEEIDPVTNDTQMTVTSSIVSNSYDVGLIGFYPTGFETSGDTTYNTEQGVLKIATNGVITYYPGKAGTSHVLIVGTSKQAIYALTVNADNSYTFKPFTTTVTYSEFEDYPNVVDRAGNSTATKGTDGIEVTFVDEDETIFVVKGDDGYKTLLTQVTKNGALYEVTKKVVGTPITVTGEVSNIKGNLRTFEDNGTTVIYAEKNRTTPASYAANGTLFKVTIGTDYALTATPIEIAASNITTLNHLQGTDVVAYGANTLTAIQEGTGIYETATGKYVRVKVSLNDSPEITVTELPAFDVASYGSTITLMDEYKINDEIALFVDETNKYIYGDFSGEFVVKIDDTLYKRTVANSLQPISLDVLTALGWTDYVSADIADPNILRLDESDSNNHKLIAQTKGTAYVTFKSPNGLEKKLKITIDDQYNMTVDPDSKDILTYTSTIVEESYPHYVFNFDFNITENIELNYVEGTTATVRDDKKISISKQFEEPVNTTISIKIPELATNQVQEFILTSDDGRTFKWKPQATDSTVEIHQVINE